MFAKPRIIFGIDATGSRQATWDKAAGLRAQMFGAAGNISAQLVYYQGGTCKSSQWLENAASLSAAMFKIRCVPGLTQIGKMLRHAIEEHAKCPVSALILISDAFEEVPEQVYSIARELKVPAFMFQEGDDEFVAGVYTKITEITGGAYAKFDHSSTSKLGELLKAVATYAVGGTETLEKLPGSAARLLLAQVKK